jgi:PAS domain S-box-containing protein
MALSRPELLEALITASPDAIVVVDASGMIEMASPAVEALFGYPPAELIGEPVEKLVPERKRASHQRHQADYRAEPVARAMGSGLDLFGQRRDGTTFPVDVSLAPVNLEGQFKVAAYVRDATARRRHLDLLHHVNEISQTLLGGAPTPDTLWLTAARARGLVDARASWIVVPHERRELVVAAADGAGTEQLQGARLSAEQSLSARVVTTGESIAIPDMAADPAVLPEAGPLRLGPGLYLPLHAEDASVGTLVVARAAEDRPFDPDETRALEVFAAAAAIVLSLGQAREDVEQLQIVAEHERIARDLHDSVIQRLFALGMSLQGVQILADGILKDRVASAVDAIDEVIRDIRETIFELGRRPSGRLDVRQQLRQAAAEAAEPLGFAPRLAFRGPVDTAVDEDVLPHVVAVAREALSNAARHAHASRVDVILDAKDGWINLSVADDGAGAPDGPFAGHGLANLDRRAVALGGQLTLRRRDPCGTVLEWRVPIGGRPE